jgi:hypothetical protein
MDDKHGRTSPFEAPEERHVYRMPHPIPPKPQRGGTGRWSLRTTRTRPGAGSQSPHELNLDLPGFAWIRSHSALRIRLALINLDRAGSIRTRRRPSAGARIIAPPETDSHQARPAAAWRAPPTLVAWLLGCSTNLQPFKMSKNPAAAPPASGLRIISQTASTLYRFLPSIPKSVPQLSDLAYVTLHDLHGLEGNLNHHKTIPRPLPPAGREAGLRAQALRHSGRCLGTSGG